MPSICDRCDWRHAASNVAFGLGGGAVRLPNSVPRAVLAEAEAWLPVALVSCRNLGHVVARLRLPDKSIRWSCATTGCAASASPSLLAEPELLDVVLSAPRILVPAN